MEATRSLLSERRNSFLLTIAFLLTSFLLIVFFTTDSFNRFSSFYFPSSDLKSFHSIPLPPQSQLILHSTPNPRNLSASHAGDDALMQGKTGEENGIPEDGEEFTEEFDFNWEICGNEKDSKAADNIPCLDNMKAIKALKSRRRMEHRERHCPIPSPRCLAPLPLGYRVPVPWPKSRDMVRLRVRYGMTMFLTLSWLSTRRTKIGSENLVTIFFFLAVELSLKMESTAIFSLLSRLCLLSSGVDIQELCLMLVVVLQVLVGTYWIKMSSLCLLHQRMSMRLRYNLL